MMNNPKDIFYESIELQLKAREIGLDWLEVDGVISKMFEETREVQEAIDSQNKEDIIEELGDLLFTYISLVRHLNLSIDEVMIQAKDKFEKRYLSIRDMIEKSGKSSVSPNEMQDMWDKIKK